MAQLAQGQRLTLPITGTQGYYFSTSGAAIVRVTPSNGGAFVVTIGNDETDVGWFGFDASLELIAQSGVLTYNATPSALTAVQLGAQRDSDAVDVALSYKQITDSTATSVVNSLTQFKLSQSQPTQITKPSTKYGKVVANFLPSQWTATIGSPTLTQGFTGFDANGNVTGVKSRTGQQGMLLVEPTVNTATRLQLGTPTTNILTTQLGGKVGLWCYVEPAAANGEVGFTIKLVMSTNPGASTDTNGLLVNFAPNTVREGWNFLTFVMRNPLAYVTGNPDAEANPLGVSALAYGTGAFSNIKDNAITLLWVEIQGSGATGSKIYLDSVWTDFAATPQVVLGCDGGINVVEIALPIFQQYGWTGYAGFPYRVWVSGSKIIPNLNSNVSPDGYVLYENGWDFTNHTANHLQNGTLTNPAEIDYEVTVAQAWQNALGLIRGAEFYVSPQSSTSRLSEKVIRELGFVLQRNFKHRNNHVTPFGIDNPSNMGSYDIGSATNPAYQLTTGGSTAQVTGWQQFSKIKVGIDLAIAYGYADFPFWHGITTVGDNGSGEGLTGDNLLIYASAFVKTCEYIREKELAGEIEVCRGMSGFYYGVSND